MELQTLIQSCLLFSKSTVTRSDTSCTNLVKVECPVKYDTVRHGRTKEGIRIGGKSSPLSVLCCTIECSADVQYDAKDGGY